MTVFGLTIEKLFLVALLAAVIIGPRRMPQYAAQLGRLIRRVTVLAGDAARQAEEEAGVARLREDWRALDPRQYDPRRIIREAWVQGDRADAEGPEDSPPGESVTMPPREPDSAPEPVCAPEPDSVPEPAGAWMIAGSSGHPRRVWVPMVEATEA